MKLEGIRRNKAKQEEISDETVWFDGNEEGIEKIELGRIAEKAKEGRREVEVRKYITRKN